MRSRLAAVYSGIDVYWHGLATERVRLEPASLPSCSACRSPPPLGSGGHRQPLPRRHRLGRDAVPWDGLVAAGGQRPDTDRQAWSAWSTTRANTARAGGSTRGWKSSTTRFLPADARRRFTPHPTCPMSRAIPIRSVRRCPPSAGGAPYRVVSVDRVGCSCPAAEAPEWDEVRVKVTVPAGTEWIALQLESEADQHGESGAWGGSFMIVDPIAPPPPATSTRRDTTSTTTTTTTSTTTTSRSPAPTTRRHRLQSRPRRRHRPAGSHDDHARTATTPPPRPSSACAAMPSAPVASGEPTRPRSSN